MVSGPGAGAGVDGGGGWWRCWWREESSDTGLQSTGQEVVVLRLVAMRSAISRLVPVEVA